MGLFALAASFSASWRSSFFVLIRLQRHRAGASRVARSYRFPHNATVGDRRLSWRRCCLGGDAKALIDALRVVRVGRRGRRRAVGSAAA